MRRIVLICLLVVLVIANVKMHIPAEAGIDPRLKPYVETFLKYCKLYKTDCSKTAKFKIVLVKIPDRKELFKLLGLPFGTVIGQCWERSNEIHISEDYYKSSTPVEMESLLIHELGHCILDLDHTEDTETDIMNPFSLPGYVYLRHYNELINRYFNCTDFCPVIEYNESTY